MCLGKNRSFSLVEGRNEFWALSIKPVYTYASAFLNEISPSLVANPTRVRIQLWLEIPPGSGWIFTHGRIFTRGKELEVTLVVFSTVWLVFLPDTLVCPDVAVLWCSSWPAGSFYCHRRYNIFWPLKFCLLLHFWFLFGFSLETGATGITGRKTLMWAKTVNRRKRLLSSGKRLECKFKFWIKYRENCGFCPMSLFIVRQKVLSWIQVFDCKNCNQCLKCHKVGRSGSKAM